MRSLLIPIAALSGAIIALERYRRLSAERLAAATLETLLNAIDANDALTGGHVRRVAAYALALADAIHLSPHERRDVERVSLFHDIGKLHEALYDIIHDADALTEAERREIATHPQKGADVLAPLTSFYPALGEGVLAHHERWDGLGYPRKLRGEDIPLTSRIVAIADTFDAITASRRYHKGENVARALAVIRDGRGAQFDPSLVDVFLSGPVQARVAAVTRTTTQPTRRPNRRHATEHGAPDVSFRWRDGMTPS